MSEADVTYTDVQFKTTKTSAVLPSSNDTTYAEIKILKSEPPVCTNCSQQQAGSNSERHVTLERAALLVCSVLLVAAVITLGVTAFSDLRYKEYKQLKEENEALKKNLSEQTTCPLPSTSPPAGLNLNEKCLKCEAGWELHGVKCYYFTTTKSSWKDSRDGCKRKGGDLVKIDSREEQKFLEARLREKMEEAEDRFWIGLTDSEEERRWLWVDGSSLDTCLRFWNGKEPDNWKGENPDGEDCVRMGEKAGAADLKCWFDQNCNALHKSICEKAAETR